MIAYLPTGTADDDYSHIRADGMWYQEWQGGYQRSFDFIDDLFPGQL